MLPLVIDSVAPRLNRKVAGGIEAAALAAIATHEFGDKIVGVVSKGATGYSKKPALALGAGAVAYWMWCTYGASATRTISATISPRAMDMGEDCSY